MKKFITIILSLVLVLSMFTSVFAGDRYVYVENTDGSFTRYKEGEEPADAVSEATEDVSVEEETPEITFRGIPWGTTLEDFAYNYNEFSVDVWDPHISELITMPNDDHTKISVYLNGFSLENGAGFDVYKFDYSNSLGSVAGYPISKVEYRFIFSPDSTTGHPDYTTWNAKLFSGLYSFVDMNDASLMVDDLITKLTSTYGDVVDQDNTDLSTLGRTDFEYMWEDDNGNWIILTYRQKSNDSDSVYLSYYSGDIFTWANELKEAANKADRDNFVASDTSEGL